MKQGVKPNSDAAKARAPEHPSSPEELGRRISLLVDQLGGRSKASMVAERSGDQIWKYVRGTAEPPFMPMARMCQAAGARLEWLATGQGPMLVKDEVEGASSQSLSGSDLTMAIQLAAEALEERQGTLPPAKFAELVTIIFELLRDGLPEAKVLRFARAMDGREGG